MPRVRHADLYQAQRGCPTSRAAPTARRCSVFWRRPRCFSRTTLRATLDRLQLSPERLLAHNPVLVVASGTTGPYAHMSAMEHYGSGRCPAPRRPREARRAADQGRCRVRRLRRHRLFAAISAALFQRERAGRGQIVEVPEHDIIYPRIEATRDGLRGQGPYAPL
ncbi:CoA transferase [Rhodococcus opacus]|uniref:CoA transferase n=1 Tax=Rhodococcus opacus TaxID=37919 RepID=UPI00358EBF43